MASNKVSNCFEVIFFHLFFMISSGIYSAKHILSRLIYRKSTVLQNSPTSVTYYRIHNRWFNHVYLLTTHQSFLVDVLSLRCKGGTHHKHNLQQIYTYHISFYVRIDIMSNHLQNVLYLLSSSTNP